MIKRRTVFRWALGLLLSLTMAVPGRVVAEDWVFTVAGDMRRYIVYDGIHGWDQACQAIAAAGPGLFMVSPGDLDQQYTSNPGDIVYQVIEQEIAPGFPFFPGVGNHEFDDLDTMDWIRGFDHGGPGWDVNPGPPGDTNTTYSWDQGNAHFVMLNECFADGNDLAFYEGNWNPVLDAWLRADLAANTRPLVFVFGHFPGYPQPDRDTGVEIHLNDTDFNTYDGGVYRDALWDILVEYEVTAYICGHTHASSVVQVAGVWQVDQGHARGPRSPSGHGPSTFMRFLVGDDNSVILESWRQPYTEGEGNEAAYTVWHTDTLRTADVSPAPNDLPATRLVAAWPNPFNPQTTVSWTQEADGHVSVDVFDLSGRRVVTLVEGRRAAGPHSVVWDGRGTDGRRQAAGTYLVRFRQDRQQDDLKIVLLP